MSVANHGGGAEQRNPSPARRWLQPLLGLLVLALATLGAWLLIQTKPSARRTPKARQATLVEVTEVAAVRRKVMVEASGTVIAANSVEVRPEVSGRVSKIGEGLVPGTVLRSGELLAQLDARDYQLAVARAKSNLARARAALAIEQGNQRLARAELEQFEKEDAGSLIKNKTLALRKPQLASAQAAVADAKAAVAQARLDASRTRITAPFDAVVRDKVVTVGMSVTPSSVLARLVGSQQWWVEVAVAKDELRWLQPNDAKVFIYDESAWGADAFRSARLLRIGAEVFDGGRMAKVVVAVDDPLGMRKEGTPKMLLGSWVRVQIEGTEVQAVELDRKLLRDGDTVWVMDGEGKLDVREVAVGARSRETVYVVGGLSSGDKVVSSALRPVEGMRLRVRGKTGTEARRP